MFNTGTLWASLGLSVVAILLSRFYAPRRFVRLVVVSGFLLVALLSVGYLAADYFTGAGINEAVIYHLKAGMGGAGLGDYTWLIVGAVGVVTLAVIIAGVAWCWVRRHSRPASLLASAVVVVLTGAGVAVNPAARDLYHLQQQTTSAREDVALPASHMQPTLTPPEKPLNVVVLYLESFERTYLNEDEFPGLAPNLSRLEPQSTYFTQIQQVTGTGWTIGGMVASQCGIPLMAPGQGNAMSAMPDFLPLANCLGDHLKRQGYLLDFMGGADLSFAGKGKFYRTHGFSKINGSKALSAGLDAPSMSAWGLYDDTLLTLFRQRLKKRAERKLPFGLFGLTLDTHHPEGHMPPACDGIEYADGSNPMLNAVHCSDRLVGEFIEAFQQSPAAENTVLLVMSDHLAMRNSAWEKLKKNPRRDLMMLFGPGLEPQAVDKPGSTLDMAPTLLGAMGYDVDGWGFGRNLLRDADSLVEREGDNANAFLNRQRSALAALWKFPGLEEGLAIKPGKRQVTMAGQDYSLPVLLTLDEQHNVARFISARRNRNDLPAYLAKLEPNEPFIWIDQCRNVSAVFAAASQNTQSDAFCLASGTLQGRVDPQPITERKLKLSQQDIEQRLSQNKGAAEKLAQRQLTLRNFLTTGTWHSRNISWSGWQSDDDLRLRSAAFGKGASRVRYREQGLKNADGLQRGVSLVGVSPGMQPELIAHVDTCQADTPDTGFAERIDSRRQDYAAFAVLVHDTAFCDSRDGLTAALKGTGLEQWRELEFRQPYIGVITADGGTREITGSAGEIASLIVQRRK